MTTVLSMCQGGIWRVTTRSLMALAQGLDSSYVTSDIGAIESLRWQFWHFSWKIGAMSLVNVTGLSWSDAPIAVPTKTLNASTLNLMSTSTKSCRYTMPNSPLNSLFHLTNRVN